MVEKKRMLIMISTVAGALLIVIAIICVSAYALRANRAELSPVEGENLAGEMGIGYGGDFNEFDTNIDEADDEVYKGEVPTKDEKDAEVVAVQKEFEESVADSFMDENGQIKEEKENGFGSLKMSEDTQETSEIIQDETENDGEGDASLPVYDSEGYAENEVLCDATSWEEAEKVAAQISGTVLSCENGVATIQIQGSVDALLEELERQGSELQLYRNYFYSMP